MYILMTKNCECQYNSAVYVCITIAAAAVENNQTFFFFLSLIALNECVCHKCAKRQRPLSNGKMRAFSGNAD